MDNLFKAKPINEPKKEEIYLRKEFRLYYGLVTKITDEYFFSYSTRDIVKISFIKYGSITTLEKTKIEFKRNIHSVSISPRKNKVYACLTNSREVIIFNFDLKNELMEQNKNEITDEGGNKFNKCIEISNNLVATADNECIIIWEKNVDTYTNKKKLF